MNVIKIQFEKKYSLFTQKQTISKDILCHL